MSPRGYPDWLSGNYLFLALCCSEQSACPFKTQGALQNNTVYPCYVCSNGSDPEVKTWYLFSQIPIAVKRSLPKQGLHKSWVRTSGFDLLHFSPPLFSSLFCSLIDLLHEAAHQDEDSSLYMCIHAFLSPQYIYVPFSLCEHVHFSSSYIYNHDIQMKERYIFWDCQVKYSMQTSAELISLNVLYYLYLSWTRPALC